MEEILDQIPNVNKSTRYSKASLWLLLLSFILIVVTILSVLLIPSYELVNVLVNSAMIAIPASNFLGLVLATIARFKNENHEHLRTAFLLNLFLLIIYAGLVVYGVYMMATTFPEDPVQY